MRLIALAFFWASLLAAQTFDVIHKKPYWPDGHGQMHIGDDAIEFEAREKENSRRWPYLDIQHFDRISEREFVILSYEDQRWKLGRDREFRFVLTSGELSDAVLRAVSGRLSRPLTNRKFSPPPDVVYELPVKHLHTLGGCEGRLLFTRGAIYYETPHAPDAREWQLARDVQSVFSVDRYQLQIRVFEANRREASHVRVFQFQLKRPLDPAFYRDLKLDLYGIEQRVIP